MSIIEAFSIKKAIKNRSHIQPLQLSVLQQVTKTAQKQKKDYSLTSWHIQKRDDPILVSNVGRRIHLLFSH